MPYALVGDGHLTLDGKAGHAVADGPVVDTSESFSVGVTVRLADLEPARPMTVLSVPGTYADAFKVRYSPSAHAWQLVVPKRDRAGAPELVLSQIVPADGGQGQGHYLAVVYDDATDTVKLYLDGYTNAGATAALPASWRGTGPLQIGRGLTPAVPASTCAGTWTRSRRTPARCVTRTSPGSAAAASPASAERRPCVSLGACPRGRVPGGARPRGHAPSGTYPHAKTVRHNGMTGMNPRLTHVMPPSSAEPAPTGTTAPTSTRMPTAVYILGLSVFALGTSEFMLSGLLPAIAEDMDVSIPRAGLLISAFAIGMVVGAPLLAVATLRLPRKTTLIS